MATHALREMTKDQANAAGREARMRNQERLPPANCEGGEIETAWYTGYDRADYSINVDKKVEKPKQEFVFPGASKDDPPIKRGI